MKLNINFKKEYEEIINANQELADWFERNQKTMVHLDLTDKDCTDYEDNPFATQKDIVLGKMSKTGLKWLEDLLPIDISDELKAHMVAFAMGIEYEKNKKLLSNYEKRQLYIKLKALVPKSSKGRKK